MKDLSFKHRNYLRDLIVTVCVYLKMMEKFCQGSVLVQTKVKNKKKSKKKVAKPKQPSKEEVLVRKICRGEIQRVNFSLIPLILLLQHAGKAGGRMGRAYFNEFGCGALERYQLAGRGTSSSARRSIREAN
jgi:hypothetical protein